MEHIALMEQTIGAFPRGMVAKSPSAKKYFHSDGSVRVGDLDRDCKRHVRKAQPLAGVVKPVKHAPFLALLRGLLCLDPLERVSAYDALRWAWNREANREDARFDTAPSADAVLGSPQSDDGELPKWDKPELDPKRAAPADSRGTREASEGRVVAVCRGSRE